MGQPLLFGLLLIALLLLVLAVFWASRKSQRVHELEQQLTIQSRRQHQSLHQLQRQLQILEEAYRVKQQESQQDPLTGLKNRRFFDTQLDQEWHRHLRRHASLALIFIDIDYFKRLNDSAGHTKGDACLKWITAILQRQCRRAGEFVARYGGEEFVVLMPNTELHGAILLAERLQREIEHEWFPHPDSPLSRLSVSMGISAMIPVTEKSQSQLLEVADRALYVAKRSGRNRIVTQDQLSERPGMLEND